MKGTWLFSPVVELFSVFVAAVKTISTLALAAHKVTHSEIPSEADKIMAFSSRDVKVVCPQESVTVLWSSGLQLYRGTKKWESLWRRNRKKKHSDTSGDTKHLHMRWEEHSAVRGLLSAPLLIKDDITCQTQCLPLCHLSCTSLKLQYGKGTVSGWALRRVCPIRRERQRAGGRDNMENMKRCSCL